MMLKDFVASIGEGNFYAIKSLSHNFQGRSGNIYSDNGYAGFTWLRREGFGSDWGLGKVPVIRIEVYHSKFYNRDMPCAVIE